MTIKKVINGLFVLLFLSICFNACVKDNQIGQSPFLAINLKWNKAYASETHEHVEIGLKWTLSVLGAKLPKNVEFIDWQDNQILQLNINNAGFNESAQSALNQLVSQLKNSEEYKVSNAIDIGRFIMLTLNASNHYYKITGASPTYLEYRKQFKYSNMLAAIVESSISIGQRKIELPESNLVNEWSYISTEGTGKISDGSFKAGEHEAFDIMPNGQLRFTIYDVNNNLALSANNTLSSAGKPAKCLWCHESTIQTSFVGQTSIPGFHTIDSFKSIIAKQKTTLFSYQIGLSSGIDFTKKQDHTFMELLYISFSEPSAERLALEWQLSIEKVKQVMDGLPTHQHPEFPYLGTLYDRKDADLKAPFKTIRVPDSARDFSDYEPNLIK